MSGLICFCPSLHLSFFLTFYLPPTFLASFSFHILFSSYLLGFCLSLSLPPSFFLLHIFFHHFVPISFCYLSIFYILQISRNEKIDYIPIQLLRKVKVSTQMSSIHSSQSPRFLRKLAKKFLVMTTILNYYSDFIWSAYFITPVVVTTTTSCLQLSKPHR